MLQYLKACLQIIASRQIHAFLLLCFSRQIITSVWLSSDAHRSKKKSLETTNLNDSANFLVKSMFNYFELIFDSNQCTEFKETRDRFKTISSTFVLQQDWIFFRTTDTYQ